jgi:hypothetical protein
MKKLSYVALAALFALASCREAELPTYGKQRQAINFWVAPDPYLPPAVYPGSLEKVYNIDLTSSAYFVSRKFEAFSNLYTIPLAVEIMGYPLSEDRRVAIVIDPELSSDGVEVALEDYYTIPAGEGTASFPTVIDMGELVTPGETKELVFSFDPEGTEFIAGLPERQHYTMRITGVNDGSPRIPTTVDGFGLMTFLWAPVYQPFYGEMGMEKFKFLSVVLGTTNLSGLPSTQKGADALGLKAALEEYKALSAVDPAKYPPLYQSGETWISFP